MRGSLPRREEAASARGRGPGSRGGGRPGQTRRRAAGPGTRGGTPRHPERRAGVSRTRRARARAPLASPRAFQEVIQRGPAAGRFGCLRRAAGGVAFRDVRDAARPRHGDDQSAGVVPAVAARGRSKRNLRLLLRPARFFVAGLRFGLLDPDRAAPPEPVDQVALDRCELVERRGARRRAHARLARLLLRRQFRQERQRGGERRNGPPARAATGVAQVRQRERVFRRLTHFDRALCRKAPCR